MSELLTTLIWAALLGALGPLGDFLMMFLQVLLELVGSLP